MHSPRTFSLRWAPCTQKIKVSSAEGGWEGGGVLMAMLSSAEWLFSKVNGCAVIVQ